MTSDIQRIEDFFDLFIIRKRNALVKTVKLLTLLDRDLDKTDIFLNLRMSLMTMSCISVIINHVRFMFILCYFIMFINMIIVIYYIY